MKYFILMLMVLSSVSIAQKYDNYIKGRITEKQTGKPIPGVNVYLNETMSGSTSDELGYFKIISIPPGHYELVASMVGYEVFAAGIEVEERSSVEQKIYLQEKIYDFGAVEVTAEKSTEWISSYEKFKKMFLGDNEFSHECEIDNKYYINFKTNGSVLTASAKEQLIIENYSLGYRVKCDLIDFRYNDATKDLRYVVKTFFEEMKSDKENVSDEYKTMRNSAYYGSLQHFLQSLVKGNVVNEGFEMRLISSPSEETNLPPGFRIVTPDAIIKKDDSGLFSTLEFSNYLQVKYENIDNTIFQTSFLALNYSQIFLDDFGEPQEIIPFKRLGAWSKDGVANMLPKYYSPNIF